ncbi:MAG: ISAzo13-like element ISCARN37 family transposase, partial [Metallibacterium sp.]
MQGESTIKRRWEVLRGVLDERQRRLFVGVEALVLGRGGISHVAA